MEECRKNAYEFLLCAAMQHVKWDLAFAQGGCSRFIGGYQREAVRRAALRSSAFHNLAFFVSTEMEGFDEGRFWDDILALQRDCPGAHNMDYQGLFERKLSGDDPLIIEILAPVE